MSRASVTDWLLPSSLWNRKKKKTGASEGKVEMYLTLWQTFFPAGSSVCEEDKEQQSRALRAPRRRFISTDSENQNLGPNICLTSLHPVFSFFSTCSPSSQRFFLSTLHPSLHPPLYRESSCGSSAAREVETPGFPLSISWGSQSHFLLFSQTQSFLKMVEHSHTKLAAHTGEAQTHTPDVHLFPRIYCWQSSRMWWRTPSSSL